MSGYDVCASLSESALNCAAATIYTRLHDQKKVFVGSGTVTKDGLTINVGFDMTKAPVFNLSPPPPKSLVEAVCAAGAREVESRAPLTVDLEGQDPRALAEAVAESAVSFTLQFSNIDFSFKDPVSGAQTTLTSPVTLYCSVTTANGRTKFEVIKAKAPPQPTVGGQFILQNFILPTVEEKAKDLFVGLSIPPINLPGVTLTQPVVAIANKRVYVAALVAGRGPPSLPSGGAPGPNADFFVTLDQPALQASAAHAVARSPLINTGASKGSSAFNAHYNVNFRLKNPQVGLAGAELDIGFDLIGDVSAGVHVFFVPIGLGYAVHSLPKPTAHCALVPGGSEIIIVEQSLQPFTLSVVPSGGIPSKVLSWMLEFIVQGVVATLTPFVTGFLKGIRFTSLMVPTFGETIDGVSISFTPKGLSVSAIPGGIALAGNLDVD